MTERRNDSTGKRERHRHRNGETEEEAVTETETWREGQTDRLLDSLGSNNSTTMKTPNASYTPKQITKQVFEIKNREKSVGKREKKKKKTKRNSHHEKGKIGEVATLAHCGTGGTDILHLTAAP